MSHKTELTALMRAQWITPLDALRLVGCLSLSQRITEIRLDIAGTGLYLDERWMDINGKRIKAFKLLKAKKRDIIKINP